MLHLGAFRCKAKTHPATVTCDTMYLHCKCYIFKYTYIYKKNCHDV